ncbi:4332_t:CDS:2, partial [Diversispora eburnea]
METSDSDLSPTTLRGSFSYKNDNVNIVIIDVNILLRIERIDQNVARIYFVNSHDNAIRISAEMNLRDYNGNEILNLENQKQQSIRVPIEYDTDKIEQ